MTVRSPGRREFVRGGSCALILMSVTGTAGADVAPDDINHLSFGPSEFIAPSYPGARRMRNLTLPFLDAEYAGRIYSSAADVVGVYAYHTVLTQLGAAVEYDLTERRARDDARFRGLRDIKETPRLKWFATRTVAFLTGDMNVATDLAERGQGTLAQANLWATIPWSPRFMMSFGPGVAWADARYMQTYFGVTPAQAAVAPLLVHAVRAGAVDFHWNGIETYDISSRWSVGVSQYAARLHGTAADSPVTLRRSQNTVLAWLTYKVR